jgi:hypothetical protein
VVLDELAHAACGLSNGSWELDPRTVGLLLVQYGYRPAVGSGVRFMILVQRYAREL